MIDSHNRGTHRYRERQKDTDDQTGKINRGKTDRVTDRERQIEGQTDRGKGKKGTDEQTHGRKYK